MGRPSTWSNSDLDLLKSVYGKIPYSEVYALFPNRNKRSVLSKALELKITLTHKTSRPLSGLNDYAHNINAFSCLSLESAYWAGFIAADGSIQNKPYTRLAIGLKATDREHLQRFKDFMQYTGVLGERKLNSQKSKDKPYTQVYLHINACGKICEDLRELYNITSNKSLSLLPPNISDAKLLKAYLIGLIDGDGCIYITKNKLAFNVIGSRHVISWVKSYLCSYFPELNAISVNKRGNIFTFSVLNKKAIDVLNWLLDIDVPRLERKWNKIKEYSNGIN